VDAAARELTPHLLRELRYAPDEGALVHNAINTDLQAVNSR
jgi:hypothetical protein